MDKLDGLSIPMIMGDWRLTIEALEEKLSKNMAIDIDSLNEDEAANICEDIDRLEGLLSYLKYEYEKEYGG
jgi:hypothetical protein